MQNYRPFGIFRFALATLVVISHTHVLAGYGNVLAPFSLGNMGVMTFFILSGYVIAEAVDIFYRDRPGAFLINRLLRIFPPFFVALILSILLHRWASLQQPLAFFDPVEHANQMFNTANLLANTLILPIPIGLNRLGIYVDYVFVRYAWAVAVELLFYYAMAALLYLSIVPPIKRKLSGESFWTVAAIGFGLAFIVLQGIAGWVPYFMLGIGLYYYPVYRSARVLAMSAIALLCVNWHAYDYLLRNPKVHAFTATTILDLLIVMLWVLSRIQVSKKMTKIDQFFGDLTYPLYLNHYAVSIVILTLVPATYFGIGLFLGYCLLTFVWSFLAMQCSEPLTRKLRERIRGRRL